MFTKSTYLAGYGVLLLATFTHIISLEIIGYSTLFMLAMYHVIAHKSEDK